MEPLSCSSFGKLLKNSCIQKLSRKLEYLKSQTLLSSSNSSTLVSYHLGTGEQHQSKYLTGIIYTIYIYIYIYRPPCVPSDIFQESDNRHISEEEYIKEINLQEGLMPRPDIGELLSSSGEEGRIPEKTYYFKEGDVIRDGLNRVIYESWAPNTQEVIESRDEVMGAQSDLLITDNQIPIQQPIGGEIVIQEKEEIGNDRKEETAGAQNTDEEKEPNSQVETGREPVHLNQKHLILGAGAPLDNNNINNNNNNNECKENIPEGRESLTGENLDEICVHLTSDEAINSPNVEEPHPFHTSDLIESDRQVGRFNNVQLFFMPQHKELNESPLYSERSFLSEISNEENSKIEDNVEITQNSNEQNMLIKSNSVKEDEISNPLAFEDISNAGNPATNEPVIRKDSEQLRNVFYIYIYIYLYIYIYI